MGESVADHMNPDSVPPVMYSGPDPNVPMCGRQTAANEIRSCADGFRRRAAELDRLAVVADGLAVGSPEECALWDLLRNQLR